MTAYVYHKSAKFSITQNIAVITLNNQTNLSSCIVENASKNANPDQTVPLGLYIVCLDIIKI